MEELNINLGGKSWMNFCERELDENFHTFAKKVFQRDGYSCQFCGFSSSVGLSVVNLDHDYMNNKMSNLVTSCPFCVQCHFLESVGKLLDGGGQMVFLPEMSQAQLNALCHVLYASIVNGSQQARKSDAIIQSIKLRSSVVEDHYGKNMSNPAFMGQMLIDTPIHDLESRKRAIFSSVRLLPALDKFEKHILNWARNAIQS